MAIDLAWLAERVQIWAEAHYGENAHATGLETMPGHAGLSFGFTVEHGDDERDELVMRVPPKGVKRKGNTDVIRQVPLLQALHAEGVRVPPVRWWSEDEQWFDVPYFMVDRLPGTTFAFRDPACAARSPDGAVGVRASRRRAGDDPQVRLAVTTRGLGAATPSSRRDRVLGSDPAEGRRARLDHDGRGGARPPRRAAADRCARSACSTATSRPRTCSSTRACSKRCSTGRSRASAANGWTSAGC